MRINFRGGRGGGGVINVDTMGRGWIQRSNGISSSGMSMGVWGKWSATGETEMRVMNKKRADNVFVLKNNDDEYNAVAAIL